MSGADDSGRAVEKWVGDSFFTDCGAVAMTRVDDCLRSERGDSLE
jgi:hypothetical protein